MPVSRTVAALMSLEDESGDLLLAEYPGTREPLWPTVRETLGDLANEIEFGYVGRSGMPSGSAAAQRIARGIGPGGLRALAQMPRATVLFEVGGTPLVRRDGAFENGLVGPYARSVPGAVILQELPLTQQVPKDATPVYTFEPSLTRAELTTRLRPASAAQQRGVAEFVAAVVDAFGLAVPADRIPGLTSGAQRRMHRQVIAREAFARVLDRTAPALVVMEGASYGGRSGYCRELHARGIPIAEPQHGLISPSHRSYNFGAAMQRSPLRDSLPDVLLTFGEIWSRGVRHPAEFVPIGKASLEAAVAAHHPTDAKVVTILSSAFDRESLSAMTLASWDAAPHGWSVRFRPHPAERADVAALYPALTDAAGVEIDLDPDVYASLAGSAGVLGLYSTALYEALDFGCEIAVIDSAQAAFHLHDGVFGRKLTDALDAGRFVQDLAEGIRSVRADTAQVWRPGAVAAFRDFAERFTAVR